MKPIFLALLALAVVISAALLGGPLLERNRRIAELQALRAELDSARYSVDSCRTALGMEEARFRRFNRTVDSLKTVVDSFDDPAQGGGPQARYPEYLESFHAYNDSVSLWSERADTLRAHDALCRELVKGHNLLADSLMRFREALNEEG
jgi:hypothetical protein